MTSRQASSPCPLCGHVGRIVAGEDPYAVAETETGYVTLAPTQYYRGYTLFVARWCEPELHSLPADNRLRFLEEMAHVAEALFQAVRPVKMNYELLGNSVAHLHWHLIPRHADDPHLGGPAWEDPGFMEALRSETHRPEPEERDDLRRSILTELSRTPIRVIRSFT